MTLEELSRDAALSARMVRYLIANGLVPAALGTGRGVDAYGPDHLEAARECSRMMAAGMKVPAIVKLRSASGASTDGALGSAIVDAALTASEVVFRDERFELRLRGAHALRGFDARAALAASQALCGVLAALARDGPSPSDPVRPLQPSDPRPPDPQAPASKEKIPCP